MAVGLNVTGDDDLARGINDLSCGGGELGIRPEGDDAVTADAHRSAPHGPRADIGHMATSQAQRKRTTRSEGVIHVLQDTRPAGGSQRGRVGVSRSNHAGGERLRHTHGSTLPIAYIARLLAPPATGL